MYKVLIVDDNMVTRYALRCFRNWSYYGFSIQDEACNGKEAIKKLLAIPMDLVITDIKMPGMDGIKLLQEIKSINYDICVVFLSAYRDFEYAKQGIRLGVFDYLTKPIDESTLVEVLERARRHLDEKNRLKQKAEEEKKIIDGFYSKTEERALITLLKSGDIRFIKEGERTYRNITGIMGNDLPKAAKLLETILYRLYEEIYAAYPLLKKIEKMEFENHTGEPGSAGNLKSWFMAQIGQVFETFKKYELHQPDSIVKKTCEYVFNHAEGKVRLENIAREVHVRSDYIGKLFKKKTGCNLNDYITMIKMEHAKYLIKNGDPKNYEVSERLGYSSPDYFCRLFKKYTGCTPMEFRKTHNCFMQDK